jgi:hypothetical protein
MYPTADGFPEKRGIGTIYRGAVPILPKENNKEYPLYAFFLHTEKDKDLADYLSQNSSWLDAVTGDDCLICTIEKPSNWDEGWKNAWKMRLGADFEKNYAEWEALTNYSEATYAMSLANLFNVPLNHMPCMVFVEDLHGNKILQLPIIANKEDFDGYLADVLTCVRSAARANPKERLTSLENAWGKYWRKWILPQKVKQMAKSIQEWGSVISDTKDAIVNILDIPSPIIKKIGL